MIVNQENKHYKQAPHCLSHYVLLFDLRIIITLSITEGKFVYNNKIPFSNKSF